MVEGRILKTVAVAALAAAACAGCATGSGGSSGGNGSESVNQAAGGNIANDHLAVDPLTAVHDAADITGHSGTAHDGTLLQTVSAAKKVTLRGTGGYDYTARTGQLVVSLPTGGELTEVVTPGMVYMLNRSNKVPAGKWVKIDVRELSDGNLVSSGATDPASAAAALRGALSATKAGTEEIGGVTATHYTGTLDLAKAAQATGGGEATGLAMGARTFSVKQIPYQVWLDPHGRILRMVEVFTFAKVPGSTKPADQVQVTSQSELGGFGQPVKASVPADSDIYSGSGAKKQ